MKQIVLIIGIVLISLHGFSQKVTKKNFKPIFEKYGVDGCFVLYNQADEEYIKYNSSLCDIVQKPDNLTTFGRTKLTTSKLLFF